MHRLNTPRPLQDLFQARALPCAAAVFFLALSLVKMRAFLFEGRFWAEEGRFFFPALAERSFPEALGHLYCSHLPLAANLVVALAAAAPFRHAPLVLTWLAFAAQCLPVALLIAWHRSLGLSAGGLLATLLVLVGLPQAPEVWANATNLHFHFAFLAGLIAAIPPDAKPPKALFRALLALCGLSGIPANFLAPVFLLLALRTRDKERWIQFAILGGTAALQLALLLGTGVQAGPRQLPADPLLYWLALLCQLFVAPLLGLRLGGFVTAFLKDGLALAPLPLLAAALGSLPPVLGIRHVLRAGTQAQRTLLLSALLLAMLGILSCYGDPALLVSAGGGSRYFYASAALLAVVLFSLPAPGRSRAVSLLLGLLLISSALGVWKHLPGPPWGEAYARARAANSWTVDIWPQGWTMRNMEFDPAKPQGE